MMRFLISFDDGAMDSIPEEEMPEVSAASRKVVADAKEAGVWIFGAGLFRQRATVVATDGTVTEGPDSQAKAALGGFSIIEVSSREEAHRWGAAIAAACRCSQEVRELFYDPES